MNDQQIKDYLNRLSDSGDDDSTSQKNYEESDVEDHVKLDEMVPTDSDSENDVQQQERRSGVILSSDSETEEIPGTSDVSTHSRRIIIPSARNLRGKNGLTYDGGRIDPHFTGTGTSSSCSTSCTDVPSPSPTERVYSTAPCA
ncbi:unnamed protein product [Colias eurytheme]|nr:unnamed protein product [Colias eurytheme]